MRVTNAVPHNLLIANFIPTPLNLLKRTNPLNRESNVVLLSSKVVMKDWVRLWDIQVLFEVLLGLNSLLQRKSRLDMNLGDIKRMVLLYLVNIEDGTEVRIKLKDFKWLLISEFLLKCLVGFKWVQKVIVKKSRILVLFDILNFSEILKTCKNGILKHNLVFLKDLIKSFKKA